MLRLTKSDPKKLQFTNEKTNRNILFLFFSGVSFTSRQFSRVRLHEAEPGGTYYVMVEAMQDIRNLTMEMKLINDQQERENFRRIPKILLLLLVVYQFRMFCMVSTMKK